MIRDQSNSRPMFLLKKILTALILPPAGPVLLALFGLWLSRRKSRRWQHAGIALATFSLLGLIALSMPVVSNLLTASLQVHLPITRAQLQQAQAIVILGGGGNSMATEYGSDTVGSATLQRLRYGAKLARESGLPVLVSAGAPFGGRPEADSMRDVLEDEYNIKVRWTESVSRDTAENASLSTPLLRAAGVKRIALVTHSSHMPRATHLFEREGLQVFPAPTVFTTAPDGLVEGMLPEGIGSSREALREHLGLLFNRLKDALP
jgi:uncharacterized SAM-binding protein YcdF (DUF218 family)